MKQTAADLLSLGLKLPEWEPSPTDDDPIVYFEGDHLDNVMGTTPSDERSPQEYILSFESRVVDGTEKPPVKMNLVELLRLATIGAKHVLKDEVAPDPSTRLTEFDPLYGAK